MNAVVADTHSLVWYLANDPRLSPAAIAALDQATASGEPIYVPVICLVELTYLAEKGRLPLAARQSLADALDDPRSPCRLVPLDRAVADALPRIDRTEIPDLPDRIVAATALALQLPLVTRDEKIRASPLLTIW
jgi:PIN domain nuclease of toxin-antitoxin system